MDAEHPKVDEDEYLPDENMEVDHGEPEAARAESATEAERRLTLRQSGATQRTSSWTGRTRA